MKPMSWPDQLARQPGGNGPRELHLSADFICAMAGPSVFEPLRARDTGPQAKQTTRAVGVASKGRR